MRHWWLAASMSRRETQRQPGLGKSWTAPCPPSDGNPLLARLLAGLGGLRRPAPIPLIERVGVWGPGAARLSLRPPQAPLALRTAGVMAPTDLVKHGYFLSIDDRGPCTSRCQADGADRCTKRWRDWAACSQNPAPDASVPQGSAAADHRLTEGIIWRAGPFGGPPPPRDPGILSGIGRVGIDARRASQAR
jgi:hypothetical protein